MKAILEDYKIYLFETARVKKTIESYLGNTRQLLEWLDDKDIDIDHLDRMIILKYLEHLEDKKYKVNTYNTKVNTIASFNNYLKDKGVIEKDIIFGKDKISLSRNREVDVYSDAEMKSIEAHIGSDTISQRDSLIIKMLKELGIRVSELTNLRLEDIDIVGLQVEVQGKNNKRRILPIKANLASEIGGYISGSRKINKYSSSPYLFISERSKQLHRNTILDIVKEMGRTLKIKECYCHKFRHSLATNMSRNDVPIQVIQQFLGHAEIQTTIEYYIQVDRLQLINAIKDI